jgi:hypothetical protein
VVRQWIVNNDRTKGVSTKEVAEALDKRRRRCGG